jgi:hypothetical protein
MAAHPVAPEERRSALVAVRLTEGQRATAERKARQAGNNLSDYLRAALLPHLGD